jgi:hypothetical protein
MVKERLHGAPQLNLRLSPEHHERMRKVAELLQSTEVFAARLDELIVTANEPPKNSFLCMVVDRIERMEAALLAAQAELNTLRAAASDTSDAIAPHLIETAKGPTVDRERGVPERGGRGRGTVPAGNEDGERGWTGEATGATAGAPTRRRAGQDT